MGTSTTKRAFFEVTAVAATLTWAGASLFATGEPATRVACVGDSITAGEGIRNRQADSYPAQLGKLLGERFEVKNFGHNGATMAKVSYRPYWNLPEFRAATEFRPNVVIIQLGANDADPIIWVEQKQKESFRADYNAMIDHFAGLETKPLVYLCLPAPFRPGKYDERRKILRDEVTLIVREIAQKRNLPVIDLYGPLEGRPELFPDYVHPNAAGAMIMAETIYKAITGKVFPAPHKSTGYGADQRWDKAPHSLVKDNAHAAICY